MVYLVFLFITLALLAGFFVLTSYEERRGARVYAPQRAALDEHIDRIEFVLEHVDLVAFAKDETKRFVGWVSHSAAHLSLQAVRSAERFLTRAVRYLRTRHVVDTAPGENVREFVKTLSDFKEQLKETTPEVPEI